MRLGLVFDLREDYRAMGYSEEAIAEFDSPDTIDAIASTLESLGFEIDRIGHIRQLAARLVAGERWDLVFNVAEGLKGRCREAQVPALLEAYDVPYVFSDPLVMATCLDKAVAKRLAGGAGIATARFAVIESLADLAAVDLPYPLFVKPIAEGTGKGCELASIVRTPEALADAVGSLLARFRQPVLVETYLSGREFTVGVLGNDDEARVIGVLEVELLGTAEPGVYSLTNKEECESRVRYVLRDDEAAQGAAKVALAAYRALDCRDSCRLDIRCDDSGRPHFIEANPLAGLHPHHSDLPILATQAGIAYRDLLGGIVGAALKRYGLERPAWRHAVAAE